MNKNYQTPCMQSADTLCGNLLATSWEMQDNDGNTEDGFGIVEGDPEGGLGAKPRYSLWD